MRNRHHHLVFSVIAFILISSCVRAQDGAALFKQNCAACHKLGARLVGPDLIGVSDRRSEDWLVQFIKSSQSMVKSGDKDAIAIFEEYNQIVMTDQAHLGDNEIKAILSYIKSEGPSGAAVATAVEDMAEELPVVVAYSADDVEEGKRLFSGKSQFNTSGPSCISCHHVNNDELIAGGLLAKDLTNVYGRMGDAGIAGILGAPPFPAMAAAYGDNPLDSAEIARLTAFFKNADEVSQEQAVNSGTGIFLFGGSSGLIVLFLFIALHWKRRLKESVKQKIYQRQIKSI